MSHADAAPAALSPRGRVAVLAASFLGPRLRRLRTGADAGGVALGHQEPDGLGLHAGGGRRLVRPLHRGPDARGRDRRDRAGPVRRSAGAQPGARREHPPLLALRRRGSLRDHAGADARAPISGGAGHRRRLAQRDRPGRRELADGEQGDRLRRDGRRHQRRHPALVAMRADLADHARLLAVALPAGGAAGPARDRRASGGARVAAVARRPGQPIGRCRSHPAALPVRAAAPMDARSRAWCWRAFPWWAPGRRASG